MLSTLLSGFGHVMVKVEIRLLLINTLEFNNLLDVDSSLLGISDVKWIFYHFWIFYRKKLMSATDDRLTPAFKEAL